MAAGEVDLEHRAAQAQLTRVQRYAGGLRWETEVGVDRVDFKYQTGTHSHRSWHPLPMDCPLHDVPAGQASLWTALWQVACLMRPEWSPDQWRPRLRRLARTAGGLTGHGDSQPGAASPGASAHSALNDRMAEWVRRLLPLSRMPTRGIQRPAVQVREVRETTELDLEAMEACRQGRGAMLVGWRVSTGTALQWRVVAGLEGTQDPQGVFRPRSVLLLPQETEAVWSCGYGTRLDPVAGQDAQSSEIDTFTTDFTITSTTPSWQLRSLDGRWAAVEGVRVLMLDG